VTFLEFAILAAQETDPRGNQSIGWLAGLYTLGLFVAVGLLLWSFTRVMRRMREQPWQDQEPDSTDPRGDDPTS